MADRKYLITISLIALVASFSQSVRAEALYSVASLKLLCGSEDRRNEFACTTYLHGVVETWMLNDIVGVDPYRYQNRRTDETFCETINKVSDKEWLRIVRSNLNTMEPGFASTAVIKALSQKLCR